VALQTKCSAKVIQREGTGQAERALADRDNNGQVQIYQQQGQLTEL
jgi:hypothetical protein